MPPNDALERTAAPLGLRRAFLFEALDDNHPEVCKSAFDSFVAMGTLTAIQVLESVKQRTGASSLAKSDLIAWIDEAIDQIRHGSFA